MKRVFVIVLDSFGIGELPDAHAYGDQGSNTLKSVRDSRFFNCPTLKHMGLFNIEGVEGGINNPSAAFARLAEKSAGKDTTSGHWELAGIISKQPMPTFPNGFPPEIITTFEEKTGKKVLCNKTYSGTEVIKDYGEESIKTGNLIVYTSADSVFQIAAHEQTVPPEQLYEYCKIARNILCGDYAVGRVIARPFEGEYPFKRTSRRHDFSLPPFKPTMLDLLKKNELSVIGVGKINDIFAGCGLTKAIYTTNNADGMDKTVEIAKQDFNGLCFVNLVEFDAVYGHRNDVDGYANALTEFDEKLTGLLPQLKEDDLLLITADHGCDPATPSTDHSREYVPLLIYGNHVKKGVNLYTRDSFSDVSATILDYFNVDREDTCGKSFLSEILN